MLFTNIKKAANEAVFLCNWQYSLSHRTLHSALLIALSLLSFVSVAEGRR